MGPVDPPESNKAGAEMFGYYSRAVADLLAKDGADKNVICSRTTDSAALFSDAIGARISDAKTDRLKALLRQSVFVLTPQIDEMLEPVLKMRGLQAQLRSKVTSDREKVECPPKKRRMSTPASSSSVSAHESPIGDEPEGELDDYMQFLLKDTEKVEAALEKYSGELSATLENMGQRLEEILNAVMSTCRLMTSSEKEELWNRVVKLPPDSLKRASEIIGNIQGSEADSPHVIFADLEKADNITLWRLYHYVEALSKQGSSAPV